MFNMLYIDCFAGAAGDMLLAALSDLGCDPEMFGRMLEALPIDDVEITIEPVLHGALHAQTVKVIANDDAPNRHWKEIDQMLADSSLPAKVKENARLVFHRLAEAEATVHGSQAQHVHFHEVGSIDSIIDIVGFCYALEEMKIERIVCSPLPLGRGSIEGAHGTIPLPAPATLELLAGVPVVPHFLDVETVTPTAAALLVTLCAEFGPVPSMIMQGIGYGAGTRIDEGGLPNIVRVLMGNDLDLPETAERTFVIEANIDDMNPEFYEPLASKLEEAGAVDVTLIPCIMKRGRPGVLLQVIGTQSTVDTIIESIFVNSTTLGLRYYATERAACERKVETIETNFGPVDVKHAYYRGRLVNSKPEYTDLLKLGLPLPQAEDLVQKTLAKDKKREAE